MEEPHEEERTGRRRWQPLLIIGAATTVVALLAAPAAFGLSVESWLPDMYRGAGPDLLVSLAPVLAAMTAGSLAMLGGD